MELELKDRVAVVTGGAAGIGEAIARTLAAEGCYVCILDRDGRAARKIAAALTDSGLQAQSAAVDVGDPAAVTHTFDEICANRNRVDILVNAAGVLSTGLVADLPVAEWGRVSQVNLSGVLHCVKAAIPVMTGQRYGRIINIASVSAMRGGGSIGNTFYGTTKAGVVALTMGFSARTWAAWRYGQCDCARRRRYRNDSRRAHRRGATENIGANSARPPSSPVGHCRSRGISRITARRFYHWSGDTGRRWHPDDMILGELPYGHA
jgi:NADP-dependent 3-hydroxy acid dehydrogenase YdfG